MCTFRMQNVRISIELSLLRFIWNSSAIRLVELMNSARIEETVETVVGMDVDECGGGTKKVNYESQPLRMYNLML